MPRSNGTDVRAALKTLSTVATNKNLLAAVEEAAGSRTSWAQAKKNPKGLLRRNKIVLPRGVSVSLEDAPRGALKVAARVVIRCIRICIRFGPFFVCVTICIIRSSID